MAERAPLQPALAAAAVAARQWSLPEPELLRHGMNLICAAGDDVVLRVSTPTAPAEQALWLASYLSAGGLRVPRPMRDDVIVHQGCSVVAVERIHGERSVDWAEVGEMISRLHHLPADGVAGRHPLPWCGAFPWWHLDTLAADVDDLLDDGSRSGIRSALDAVRGWREVGRSRPSVVCHGDVHPGNVLVDDRGPVLIDWDLLCTGPRGWDHAALLTWTERWGGEHGLYERFADGYGWSGRVDGLTEMLATGRLLAATLMRVRAGRTDLDAAAEAERRLAFWRGDPNASPWRAQ